MHYSNKSNYSKAVFITDLFTAGINIFDVHGTFLEFVFDDDRFFGTEQILVVGEEPFVVHLFGVDVPELVKGHGVLMLK